MATIVSAAADSPSLVVYVRPDGDDDADGQSWEKAVATPFRAMEIVHVAYNRNATTTVRGDASLRNSRESELSFASYAKSRLRDARLAHAAPPAAPRGVPTTNFRDFSSLPGDSAAFSTPGRSIWANWTSASVYFGCGEYRMNDTSFALISAPNIHWLGSFEPPSSAASSSQSSNASCRTTMIGKDGVFASALLSASGSGFSVAGVDFDSFTTAVSAPCLADARVFVTLRDIAVRKTSMLLTNYCNSNTVSVPAYVVIDRVHFTDMTGNSGAGFSPIDIYGGVMITNVVFERVFVPYAYPSVIKILSPKDDPLRVNGSYLLDTVIRNVTVRHSKLNNNYAPIVETDSASAAFLYWAGRHGGKFELRDSTFEHNYGTAMRFQCKDDTPNCPVTVDNVVVFNHTAFTAAGLVVADSQNAIMGNLELTFTGCTFEQNVGMYAVTDYTVAKEARRAPSAGAIIMASSSVLFLRFIDTLFKNNAYDDSGAGNDFTSTASTIFVAGASPLYIDESTFVQRRDGKSALITHAELDSLVISNSDFEAVGHELILALNDAHSTLVNCSMRLLIAAQAEPPEDGAADPSRYVVASSAAKVTYLNCFFDGFIRRAGFTAEIGATVVVQGSKVEAAPGENADINVFDVTDRATLVVDRTLVLGIEVPTLYFAQLRVFTLITGRVNRVNVTMVHSEFTGVFGLGAFTISTTARVSFKGCLLHDLTADDTFHKEDADQGIFTVNPTSSDPLYGQLVFQDSVITNNHATFIIADGKANIRFQRSSLTNATLSGSWAQMDLPYFMVVRPALVTVEFDSFTVCGADGGNGAGILRCDVDGDDAVAEGTSLIGSVFAQFDYFRGCNLTNIYHRPVTMVGKASFHGPMCPNVTLEFLDLVDRTSPGIVVDVMPIYQTDDLVYDVGIVQTNGKSTPAHWHVQGDGNQTFTVSLGGEPLAKDGTFAISFNAVGESHGVVEIEMYNQEGNIDLELSTLHLSTALSFFGLPFLFQGPPISCKMTVNDMWNDLATGEAAVVHLEVVLIDDDEASAKYERDGGAPSSKILWSGNSTDIDVSKSTRTWSFELNKAGSVEFRASVFDFPRSAVATQYVLLETKVRLCPPRLFSFPPSDPSRSAFTPLSCSTLSSRSGSSSSLFSSSSSAGFSGGGGPSFTSGRSTSSRWTSWTWPCSTIGPRRSAMTWTLSLWRTRRACPSLTLPKSPTT